MSIGTQVYLKKPLSNEPPEKTRSCIIKERDINHKTQLDQLRLSMSDDEILANNIAQQKGSSSWLTSLPLEQERYVLSKREFYDAIALRYRWELKRIPTKCACGKTFSVDHAVSCLKGEFRFVNFFFQN